VARSVSTGRLLLAFCRCNCSLAGCHGRPSNEAQREADSIRPRLRAALEVDAGHRPRTPSWRQTSILGGSAPRARLRFGREVSVTRPRGGQRICRSPIGYNHRGRGKSV